MENKKRIIDANPRDFAGWLLDTHNNNKKFTNAQNFIDTQRNTVKSIDICIDLISKFGGTDEEKVAFLKESRIEALKFHTK